MKKSYILIIVAMLCMFATGCNKEEMKTIGRFIISEQGFVDPDSKMHFTWLDGASSHLSYDNNDALIINGHHFTLHKSGTQWYAEEQNHEDVTAANFYSIYVDPNMAVSGSGPSYNFSYTATGQISNTNGIILAGSTEDSLLTLKPACAIIRFPAGQRMDYVRVGFSSNAIPMSGSLNVSSGTPSISATSYVPGVTSESAGGFFEMINDGTDFYETYYVAVPIKNGSVSTQLFLTWKEYGSSDVYKYKTSGTVTLQQGKVYTVGKTRVAPFQSNGSSNAWFRVSSRGAVRFSPGNLQYKSSDLSWRFAPNQYSAIGMNNRFIDPFYSDYIDLFGFGSTGWNDGVSENYPDEVEMSVSGFYNTTMNLATTHGDWGVHLRNQIAYNGSNTTAEWRTLTQSEWNFLLSRLDGAGHDMYGLATINGNYKGLVLIPNGIMPSGGSDSPWTEPYSGCFTPGSASGYTTNEYTFEQWAQMESSGAIFLPVTGVRNSASVTCYPGEGHYWSATGMDANSAYGAVFMEDGGMWYIDGNDEQYRYTGCAVRLVCNR